ncbi:MAG: hypothetical protein QW738_05525 [Nitrososphaeria archaeon]
MVIIRFRRLCSLSKHANIIATVDSIENTRHLSEMTIANDLKLYVCVKLKTSDIGGGVEFSNTKSFVKEHTKL